MSALFPKEPFHHRYEFPGTISHGDHSADHLHFVIQHSAVSGGKIVGKIFGSYHDYERLKKVIEAAENPYYTIVSTSGEDQEMISSDKVIIWRSGGRRWPKNEFMISELADIELLEMEVVDIRERYKSESRTMTFYLAGPSDPWNVHTSRTLHLDGKVEVSEPKNTLIKLDEPLPFEVYIRPSFHFDRGEIDSLNNLRVIEYSSDYDKGQFNLDSNILTLELETAETEEVLSDDDFMKIGREVVDDILTLLSFISLKWNTWHIFNFSGATAYRKYVKHTREVRRESTHNSEDYLIGWQDFRDFLFIAYPKYRALKQRGLNLFQPIIFLIAGNDDVFIEQKFSLVFLALEKLKDLYLVDRPELKNNLDKKTFKKIRKLIIECLPSLLKDKPAMAERITDKIIELNRPSFRVVIEHILEECSVDWKTVYPNGTETITFIDTRNKLFHTATIDTNEEEGFDLLMRIKSRKRVET